MAGVNPEVLGASTVPVQRAQVGKSEGGRRRGRQRMRWLDGITDFNGHEFE